MNLSPFCERMAHLTAIDGQTDQRSGLAQQAPVQSVPVLGSSAPDQDVIVQSVRGTRMPLEAEDSDCRRTLVALRDHCTPVWRYLDLGQ